MRAIAICSRASARGHRREDVDDGGDLPELEIAPGPADTVYLFGGPAANAVSQLDLATDMMTRDLPALRAPAGAYVVGIAGN